MLIFDIESDGLLDTISTIHCIVVRNTKGKYRCYHEDPSIKPRHGSIEDGLKLLAGAPGLVGHGIQQYDIPAIQKLYPWWTPPDTIWDTLVCSYLIWSDIKGEDYGRWKHAEIPGKLIGRHSIEAWGWRFGILKHDKPNFKEFSQEMLDYCITDTDITAVLYDTELRENWEPESLRLEHDFAKCMALQEQAGFAFDREGAAKLLQDMAPEIAEQDEKLRKVFPPRRHYYKRPYRGRDYKEIPFNPNSRQQSAERLQELGWEPQVFTPSGDPSVKEEILRPLPWPEAQILADRFVLVDRRAQLEGWLEHLRPDDRLPAVAIHNGAQTGRCTHRIVVNVPKPNVLGGERFRRLFHAKPGYTLVGTDAEGLEARCLGHYLAAWSTDFIERILSGSKEAGTDIHSYNWKLLSLDTRQRAKNTLYCYIYGGGDAKLGITAGVGPRKGGEIRSKLERGIPGLRQLRSQLDKAYRRGFVPGLDGRRVPIRHKHAALNTLCQSAGAVVMKWATVWLMDTLGQHYKTYDWFCEDYDVALVCHQHDEYVLECKEEIAQHVSDLSIEAIVLAGEHYNFRCPLAAESKIGKTWMDVH